MIYTLIQYNNQVDKQYLDSEKGELNFNFKYNYLLVPVMPQAYVQNKTSDFN